MQIKLFIKNKNCFCAGQSLVEFIVAVSILIMMGTVISVAVLGSYSTSRLGQEETFASALATEGIEAVVSIRNQNWNNLTNGNHGLTNSTNVWSFINTSDVTDKFTRVITIADVFRDDGDIVQSGGTLDPNTKKINVSVSWDFTPTRNNAVTYTQYLTNWQTGRSGGNVGISCPPEANCLVVDTTGAHLGGGGKRLEGITLGNSHTSPITLDKMSVSWTSGTGGSSLIEIRINGSSVWSGSVGSATQVDIINIVLPAETGSIPINFIRFNSNMTGAIFDITFTMVDSSSKTVSGITP